MSGSESSDRTVSPSQAPTAPAGGTRTSDAAMRAVGAAGLAHLAPGTVISRYRVESVLGEGGMGVVYVARQEKPDREVALKVIRPGYATPSMLRRFEYEAEVLGRLLHPGIAQIYEAGVWTVEPPAAAGGPDTPTRPTHPPTSVGGSTSGVVLPFFAMELVRGVSLTRYAQEKNLSTRERLELLAKVCDAVQHAHQKGVIHRDLKPGNILVVDEVAEWHSGEVAKREGKTPGPARAGHHSATLPLRHLATSSSPQPKILDFGVARATDSDIQQTTLQTDVGAIIGTIPYMSPEQVGGDPNELDTRSDVYALGVIAYELLVGRLPYDLSRKMIHEAARIIREDEPTKLSSIDRTLRGDVETIVAHALEKDKARRYGAASALAADIRRYLSDEPIAARPASTWYQLSKFARRNRALVAGVGVALVALTAATGVSISFALSESRLRTVADKATANAKRDAAAAEQARAAEEAQARRATREAEIAQAVNDFLNQDFLASVAPSVDAGRGKDVRMREVLDEAARRIDAASAPGGRFADKPLVEAAIRTTIGRTYGDLGELRAALPHFRRALALHTAHSGNADFKSLDAANDLAGLLRRLGEYDEAERIYLESLATSTAIYGEDSIHTNGIRSNLAQLYKDNGRYDEAEPLTRRAVADTERLRGPGHEDTIKARQNLAGLFYLRNKHAEAEAIYRALIDELRAQRSPDDPLMVRLLINLSAVVGGQGRVEECEALATEALERGTRVMGRKSEFVITVLRTLSRVRLDHGRLAEAEAVATEGLELAIDVLGESHPDTVSLKEMLASIRAYQGRHAEAEVLARSALTALSERYGAGSSRTFNTREVLAAVLRLQDRPAEAEAVYRDLYRDGLAAFGPMAPRTLLFKSYLVGCVDATDRFQEAEALGRELLAEATEALGPESEAAFNGANFVARALLRMDRFAEAIEVASRQLEFRDRTAPDSLLVVRGLSISLGQALMRAERFDEAERVFGEAVELTRSAFGARHMHMIDALASHAGALSKSGRLADAESEARDALELSIALRGPRAATTATVRNYLADILQKSGRNEEAAAERRQCLEVRREVLGPFRQDTLWAETELVSLLGRMRLFAEAEEIRTRTVKECTEKLGADHETTRAFIGGLVTLYEEWHKSDPGKGYDAKAAEWKARLDALPAPQSPASQDPAAPPAPDAPAPGAPK